MQETIAYSGLCIAIAPKQEVFEWVLGVDRVRVREEDSQERMMVNGDHGGRSQGGTRPSRSC